MRKVTDGAILCNLAHPIGDYSQFIATLGGGKRNFENLAQLPIINRYRFEREKPRAFLREVCVREPK